MKTIPFIFLLLFALVVSSESTAQIRDRETVAPATAQRSMLTPVQVEWADYGTVNIVIDGSSYPFRTGQIRVLQLKPTRPWDFISNFPTKSYFRKSSCL